MTHDTCLYVRLHLQGTAPCTAALTLNSLDRLHRHKITEEGGRMRMAETERGREGGRAHLDGCESRRNTLFFCLKRSVVIHLEHVGVRWMKRTNVGIGSFVRPDITTLATDCHTSSAFYLNGATRDAAALPPCTHAHGHWDWGRMAWHSR